MRHSTLTLSLSTLVSLLSFATVAPAQSPYTEGVKMVGKIRPDTPTNLGRVPAPDRPAVQRNLERLRDVMLASPPFSPPVGFELQPALQGYEHTNELWKSGPYGYHVQGLIYWYLQTPASKNVHPSTVPYVSIRLNANDLTRIWGRNERWRRIDGVDAYWEPQIMGSLGRYPLYGTGKVILTKIARPLVVPLSRERVLSIELDEHRKNLSQFPRGAPRGGERSSSG
jgi:hypothetical protein